jgi:drug/metabolite transporter (DMT)-like permease
MRSDLCRGVVVDEPHSGGSGDVEHHVKHRAHMSILAVVIVWAGSFSVIKALLDDGVNALDIAIVRYAIALPGFAFVLWWKGGLPGLTRRDAGRVVVAGLLIVLGYHLSLNMGERNSTAGVAALVVALAPGMTLVLASAVGLDRLGARQVAGLVVAFAGVGIVITLGTGESLSLGGVKGPLIVVGAPLSFALYNVLVKPLLGRHDLLALTAATSLVGTVGLLPLVRRSTLDSVTGISAADAALLLYLGLLATFLGYILWNVGLKGLGPTRAVSYTYAISPLAVLIGAAVLDEPVTVWLVLGGSLVVGGIAAAQGVSLPRLSATVGRWRSASSRSAS